MLETLLAAAAVAFVLALSYPLAILFHLRADREDALRWIQNSPAFVVFLMFIMPLAVGLFASTADLGPWLELSVAAKVLSGLSGLLALVLISFSISEDLKRAPVEPFLLRPYADPLKREVKIRKALLEAREAVKAAKPDERRKAVESFEEKRAKHVEAYAAQVPALGNLKGLVQRGSICAFIRALLNTLVAAFVALFFLYLIHLVLFDSTFQAEMSNPLILIIGLLALWFPVRLYDEWYLGFYSLRGLKHYWIYVFLIVAAVVVYLFLLFQLSDKLSVQVFSAAGAALLTLLGALGKIKPEWLGLLAEIIEEMPFRWFLACLFVIVFGLVTVVLSMVGVEVG